MPWYAWLSVGFLLGVWASVLIAFLVFAVSAMVDGDTIAFYEDET